MQIYTVNYLLSAEFESDVAFLGCFSTVEKAKQRCKFDAQFFGHGIITWEEVVNNPQHFEGNVEKGGVYYIDSVTLDDGKFIND